MTPVLSILLCLGLCLCKRTRTQAADELRKPSLRAENSSLVPEGETVTLRCRASWEAEKWKLEKRGESGWSQIKSVRGAGDEGEFSLLSVTSSNAGTYRCLYSYCLYKQGHSFSLWSECSDPLELVVTDLSPPPSLAALPSSEVAPGQNVTLQCGSEQWYGCCVLYKDGEEISRSRTQRHERGRLADFFFPAVNLTHDGTYRCYGFHSSSPYLWSAPSAPLVLRVSETSPSPESENRLSDAAAQDYTVGNLVRLILAGLVIILLGVLLAEHWKSSRGQPIQGVLD